MARREGRSGGAPARTAAGQAMFEVIWLTLQTYFRLSAAGQRMGAVTAWGGGLWGMLHSLKTQGPQTVPQIARSRPVSRQWIQRLANEMAEHGLVAFADNPAHKRSKLVRLTAKGEALHAELTESIFAASERLAEDMDADDLRAAARVLEALRERLLQI